MKQKYEEVKTFMPDKDGTGRLGRGKNCDDKAIADRIGRRRQPPRDGRGRQNRGRQGRGRRQ